MQTAVKQVAISKRKENIDKKLKKKQENEISISKLKKENMELQRQIGYLGEICRRCHSTGSVSMIEQQFASNRYSSKDSICEKCDITRCKYSGRYKEPLIKENDNNIGTGMYKQQICQNPSQPGVMQQPYIPGMPNGFSPY